VCRAQAAALRAALKASDSYLIREELEAREAAMASDGGAVNSANGAETNGLHVHRAPLSPFGASAAGLARDPAFVPASAGPGWLRGALDERRHDGPAGGGTASGEQVDWEWWLNGKLLRVAWRANTTWLARNNIL